MLALRYAAVLALVFWTGGLAALGAIAAPAAFDVLGAGPEGRALAGAVFGEALGRFHRAAYVCAAAVILSLGARGILGPRPRPFGIRVALAVAMTAATAWSGLVLGPRIQALQTIHGVAPSSLPGDDPRRVEFGRLHGLSTSLQLVPVLGGLVLLFFELKD